MQSLKSTEKSNLQFPKLQIANNNNIFLMTNKTNGTCIHSETPTWLGFYSDTLCTKDLKDFNGSITLEN